MRVIGLTGGIASGKSTVSNLFKANGFPVVDADVIARFTFQDVLKRGSGGWRKVVAAFGDDILADNGEVDRAKLGQIVFTDPSKRQLLNRLLAPYISYGILWEVFKLWIKGCNIIVLDVPLLFEANMDRWTNPIIVVWVDPETQLQRLMSRDRTSAQDAQNRINAQMPLDLKRSKADIVIDNNGSLEDLNENFKKILNHVTKPLTWTEFWLSRLGTIVAVISIFSGILGCKKLLARL
ncbi:dephospho-CoA kinase-like isoform X1 [Rutidosis leptorrhynchoides]|uniref:dephospho-CoA kinase-like isoform X1 n=1 Tax=Rutidosis leptorrhynchoides TaxID=125765 RepID=UPI003A99CDEC